MRIERFQVDDLLLIQPRPPQVYPGFLAAMQSERGIALTAWNGALPVGAAGITRWPLMDEGWVYISEHFSIFEFHRLVKQFMKPMIRWMHTQRLYVRVEEAFPPTWRKWPLSLGLLETGRQDGIIHYEGLF